MTALTATLPTGAVEVLNVDAIVTESFDDSATVTSHPVEQGADVSDNIRPEPDKLTLALIVSNTPLPNAPVAAPSASSFVGPMPTPGVPVSSADPTVAAEVAHSVLKRWKNSGALLAFATTLGNRSQMAIEKIGAVRDAKTGGPPGKTGGLRISLALKYIRIVQNALITQVVSTDLRRSPTVPTGSQAAVPTPSAPNTNMLNDGLSVYPSL